MAELEEEMQFETTDTLAFSEAEANQIIAALKKPLGFLQTKKSGWTLQKLENLSKKNVKWLLHALTLGEYFKNKRIPRGLRIFLQPTLCKNNKNFLTRWRMILNKCSQDLLLLTIQELNKDIISFEKQIEEAKEHLKQGVPQEDWNKVLQNLNETLEMHRIETEKTKQRKLRRDELDYQYNRVYTFFVDKPQHKKYNPNQEPNKRDPANQKQTPSNPENTDSTDSSSVLSSDLDPIEPVPEPVPSGSKQQQKKKDTQGKKTEYFLRRNQEKDQGGGKDPVNNPQK